jgi:hypothetical protein
MRIKRERVDMDDDAEGEGREGQRVDRVYAYARDNSLSTGTS